MPALLLDLINLPVRASSRGLRTLALGWASKVAEFEQAPQNVRDTMRRLAAAEFIKLDLFTGRSL
jgi:hypothetical protein